MPDEKTTEKAGDKSKPGGVTTVSTNPRPKKNDTDLLSAAASSGDAGVQNLLAQREIAQRNGDDDAVKDIDERLRASVEK